jgi:hypothetical protein
VPNIKRNPSKINSKEVKTPPRQEIYLSGILPLKKYPLSQNELSFWKRGHQKS